ncbi:MAG: DUF4384 domain-containing protein [Muribaculaceae bacterium]|nr:DUF4384 domain-containing protein [Muribaculaceae bacterium]
MVLAVGVAGGGVHAEKLREVEGRYVYYLPRNVARDRGEQIALERAMINAVADEFGTLLSDHTRVDKRVSETGEGSDYWSLATAAVRGEWVETIGQPEFTCGMEGDDIVITCRVRGRARPVANNKADMTLKVLRNDAMTEDNTFADGDRILMRFASAVDGYLTVFLEDDNGMVYRMLPFYSERAGSKEVEGGREYLFFSSMAGDAEQYRMTASRPVERNILYAIFSPNEYVKPIDSRSSADTGLRELTAETFHRWLESRRAADPAMQVAVRPLTVTSGE